jgi:hypothetical protein
MFLTNENERRLYGGAKSTDPQCLRERMTPKDFDYEVSEEILLQALRQLDPDALMRTLEAYDDDEIQYLSDLMFDEDD